ncbi:MAG TPA: cytochrome c3 family protein [Kofleriaceae bacterium]
MRALLVALFGILALCAIARADFDHNAHERDVFTAGKDAIACSHCHTLKDGIPVGRPDHATCFGACHGPVPAKQTLAKKGTKRSVTDDQKRVCADCHTSAQIEDASIRPTVTYPPYAAGDFSLVLNHKKHAAAACTTCHTTPTDAPTKLKVTPHKRCVGCHDGTKTFAMTACATCHTPGSGQPLPAHLAEPVDTVASAFSHPKHAARGGKGAQCTTCHAAVADATEVILPRSPASSCATAGCHDGAPTFSVTGPCTRCHTTTPAKYEIKRPDLRFSHATHVALAVGPCTTCHKVSAGNEVVSVGHAPCATCHADDFMARDPKYCGACHNSVEPWRKLIADRPPAERTEFGATLSHSITPHQKPCAACHTLATADSQLRPPRGHKACTGSGCHVASGGAAPQLTQCESCHRQDLLVDRTKMRNAAPWSVREQFRHTTHEKGPTGELLACTGCHTDMSAPTVDTLATPAKPTCAGCHNGGTAFKLTGTGCTRCHTRAPTTKL